jgi:hypothetical protein
MIEQLSETLEQFSAEKYASRGGRWDGGTFYRLLVIVDEMETNPIPVRGVFIDQAKGMGKHTGLEITPKEEYLYAVLCHKPVERILGQQPLMAEVMLVLGNPDKRDKFMSSYSNVNFNPSLMQMFELRQQPAVRPIPYNSAETVVFGYNH